VKHVFRPTTLLAALAVTLSGCASLDEEKVNYKSARTMSTLDVPPDLTQLRRDSRYNLDTNSATASGLQNRAEARPVDQGTATNRIGDVRMERSGSQRWLVVQRPADKLWEPLKDFWTGNGFVLSTDAPELGILETDWAENRAKLPQDAIRATLGRIFDSLYSTSERDRFRTRIERNEQGGVDIYITHRGMQEVYADNNKDRTVWQPRASDPELEIEFLRRLMLKLGGQPNVTAAAPQTPAPASQSPATATAVSTVDGQPTIVLTDDQERAWRRVGVALDRSGFTVEDRDRRQGLYFVRYVASTTPGKEPGWLPRLFGGDSKAPELARYRVVVASAPQGSQIKVLNAQGQAEKSANAEKILKLLAAELR